MINFGSFPKWLFHDGIKCRHEESEYEANSDLLPKSSEIHRQRDYGKLADNIGCTLVGLVFLILCTVGYVAFTAKLSRHLWMPTFEYREGVEKNWHRVDHSVRNSRQAGDGLQSITEHELPALSSHETEFNFRTKRPQDGGHPPVRMFIDPVEEDLVDSVRKLAHQRPRRNAPEVAEGSMSAPRRPSRRIPVLHRDRLSGGYKILWPTDAFDDHGKVHR